MRLHPPALAVLTLLTSVAAIQPIKADTAASSRSAAALGIGEHKPAAGPYVEVDGKFMLPYVLTIPGSNVTVEMIPIPGGSYLMGSSNSEADRADDEGPQVKVNVSPMWVAKTETNWAQYKEYMKMYPIFKDFESRGERIVNDASLPDAVTAPTELYEPTYTYEYGEEPDQPAVTMTQYAAQQYTKWLSLLTGQQYRLPTEAEWEYACRGGSTTAYSWGDDPTKLEEYAWFVGNADASALPIVGTKKPNAYGLHDMHGSAAEWTVNAYTEDGYAWLAEFDNVNAIDAVQWPKKSSPCVVRGGSWEFPRADLRSAARLPSDDEVWKEDDPNFPRSPWWFTSDPARGVGFRIFRSYQPLAADAIKKFWETSASNTIHEIETRVQSGRGGYGLVDPKLPESIEQLQN